MNYPRLALALALAAACGRPDAAAEAVSTAVPAQPDTATGALVNGTPPGGLEDWIRDITTGLEGLPATARADLQVAQRKALELYVSRQEYIEIYWGEQGRLQPPRMAAELSTAVTSAETSFHDVMQSLTAPALDSAMLTMQMDTLNARMVRVLDIAKRSGATLVPPGNAGTDEGSEES